MSFHFYECLILYHFDGLVVIISKNNIKNLHRKYLLPLQYIPTWDYLGNIFQINYIDDTSASGIFCLNLVMSL